MPRNLVLCCDGTNNVFGAAKQHTNVVRVVKVLQRDDPGQLVYYDPGVGTFPDPNAMTRIGKRAKAAVDLAFATSLTVNVDEAYRFLMNTWEPEDQVFIFGFSRGAYTARVLAGLLFQIGLLPRGSENLIPYAIRLLRVPDRDDAKKSEPAKASDELPEFLKIINDFRRTFARPIGKDDDRHFRVHFLGLWDSVSSVGWIGNPAVYASTTSNPGVSIIRHAMALDERRAFFRQLRFKPLTDPSQESKQDRIQLWFPGVHSDVGGGYENSMLWRCSFDWMVKEARQHGLKVDDKPLEEIAPPLAPPCWKHKQNESLDGLWKLAEYVPKFRREENARKANHSRPRVLDPVRHRDTLHQSVLRRIRDCPKYRPANLTPAFIQYVLDLPETEIPPSMLYKPDGK